MNAAEIARCIREQAASAADQVDVRGARLGASDWLAEEVLLRAEVANSSGDCAAEHAVLTSPRTRNVVPA